MTIKVTKPEVNLREKLSELDFQILPHEKMPVGSIIQYASNTSSANSFSTSSTSFVDSGHDILFTPLFANSKIIVKLQSRRFNLVTANVIELCHRRYYSFPRFGF